jgi:anti-sigma factor RsiW
MSDCDEHGVRILSYVDNCLHGQELDDFRAHLEQCSNCRASVETERSLSQLLRRSRPLYSAPPALRERVAAIVEQPHLGRGRESGAFYAVFLRMLGSWLTDPARRVARLRLLAASLAVTAMLLAFVPHFLRQARAADYVESAVTTHRGYLDGKLSPGLQSNSPEQVTAWFNGKVPFTFRLPRAQGTLESIPTYQLTGGTLVKYRGKPAALVTYKKHNEQISLLVASADSAVVAGGDEVRSGKLIFHYRADQGFHVVTWSNHGLSYALVSSVSGSARESCMVCHQTMADRQNFSPAR